MQDWLVSFMDSGSGVLSLDKYSKLAAVLVGLERMDSTKLRQAWVDFSDADWSGEAGSAANHNMLQMMGLDNLLDNHPQQTPGSL